MEHQAAPAVTVGLALLRPSRGHLSRGRAVAVGHQTARSALAVLVAVVPLVLAREPLVAQTLAAAAAVAVLSVATAAQAAPVWSSFVFVPHKQSDNERKRAWLTQHA
jgi:hypothetical protein